MIAPPLGTLAFAILEQHGAAVEAAVASILEQERAALPPDRRAHVAGYVYGEREVARQSLQTGNWVTLGEITTGVATTFVEVNVATGEMRQRRA
jgi:hypothetical protein